MRMTDLEPSTDSPMTSELSSVLPTSQQPEENVSTQEKTQESAELGSSNVTTDIAAPIVAQSVDLKSSDTDASVSTSTEPATVEKVAVETTNHSEPPVTEAPVTGQQYFVVLTSDQNGKVLGAVPQGATMVSSGMLPNSTLLRPQTPVTVKRGAAKTDTVTKPANPTTITMAGAVVIPRAQAPPRPTVTVTSTIPQAGQALRMISLAGPTASSPSAQIFAPAGTSASAIAAVTNAIKKPAQTVVKSVSPVVKPLVPTSVVVTRTPIRPAVALSSTPTAATSVSPIRKPVVLKTAIPAKSAVTTKVIIPPSQPGKSGKPIAAVDKLMQQKRLMAESVGKMRKIERVMVQARPDQATAFSYGEIFHQTSVSFAKMAALTAHISLESQTPAEQRRWSPDLINKFVNSINSFATSMKEVGDELKKRHEHQLVVNLKRKADNEVANAKKLASLAPAAVPSAAPNVMTSFLASVSATNGAERTAVPATGSQTTTVTDPSPSVVKHPLEISTDSSTAMVALSNLLSTAKTNGMDVEKKDDEASPSGLGNAMDTSSQESSVSQSEAVTVPHEKKDLATVKDEADEPSVSQKALTNGFTEDILTQHDPHPVAAMEETVAT